MSGVLETHTIQGVRGLAGWLTDDAIIPCAKGRIELGEAVARLIVIAEAAERYDRARCLGPFDEEADALSALTSALRHFDFGAPDA